MPGFDQFFMGSIGIGLISLIISGVFAKQKVKIIIMVIIAFIFVSLLVIILAFSNHWESDILGIDSQPNYDLVPTNSPITTKALTPTDTPVFNTPLPNMTSVIPAQEQMNLEEVFKTSIFNEIANERMNKIESLSFRDSRIESFLEKYLLYYESMEGDALLNEIQGNWGDRAIYISPADDDYNYCIVFGGAFLDIDIAEIFSTLLVNEENRYLNYIGFVIKPSSNNTYFAILLASSQYYLMF